MVAGLGAAPHAYKSQLDDSGQIKDEAPAMSQAAGSEAAMQVRKGLKSKSRLTAHVTAPIEQVLVVGP